MIEEARFDLVESSHPGPRVGIVGGALAYGSQFSLESGGIERRARKKIQVVGHAMAQMQGAPRPAGEIKRVFSDHRK